METEVAEVIDDKDGELVEEMNQTWNEHKVHSNSNLIKQKKAEVVRLLSEHFTDIFQRVDGLSRIRYELTNDRFEYQAPVMKADASLASFTGADEMADYMTEKKGEVREVARSMENELDLDFPLYTSIYFSHPHDA